MLLQFNFSNFKSFANETTLDLTATGISELSHHIVHMGRERFLPVAAIFGANASGKSHVYQAFSYMRHMVLQSFSYGGNMALSSVAEDAHYRKPPSFAFDERRGDPVTCEVQILDRITHRSTIYGFSADDQGIVEEWLYERAKTVKNNRLVMYRDRVKKTLEMPGFAASEQTNINTALEPEALVVSLGAKLKVQKCVRLLNWFAHCETIDYGHPGENLYRSTRIPQKFQSKVVQEAVLEFLRTFDDSIRGFRVDEVPSQEDGDSPKYLVKTLHNALDTEDMIALDIGQESAGTLKLFSLYPSLVSALTHGSVIFVDELNARLHPLLMRNLINLFAQESSNPNHAQLIFTTHDTWHLANHSLRRDEIWFTDKQSDGESTLYSLAEFACEGGEKIRKDENYEKNYLSGKYRAIPTLRTITVSFPDFAEATEGKKNSYE